MQTYVKRIFAILLMLAIFCVPSIACAAEDTILTTDFVNESWVASLPENYGFHTNGGSLHQDDFGACIYQSSEGYSLLKRNITFMPNETYVIKAEIYVQNLNAEKGEVELFIEDQLAITTVGTSYNNTSTTMELQVKTNRDEAQQYTLCIGLGNAKTKTTGELWVQKITVEKLGQAQVGTTLYPLVGSLSKAYSPIYETSAAMSGKNRVEHDRETISYDHIGEALIGILVIVALYLVFTSKWNGRLGRFFSGDVAIFLLFVFAIVLRVYFAYTDMGYDPGMNALKRMAISANESGLSNFYATESIAASGPLQSLILWLCGGLRSMLGLSVSSSLFTFIIRFAGIVADVCLVYFLYKIAKKKLSKHTAALVAAVLLLLSTLFINSAIWGQMDSLWVLFGVLGIYYLTKDKPVISGIFMMLAMLTTFQASLFLVIYLIGIIGDCIKKGNLVPTLKKLGISVAVMAAVYAVIALPLKGEQSIFYALPGVGSAAGYASNNAFNLITLLGGNLALESAPFLFASYEVFGTVGIIVSILALGILYLRKRDKTQLFYYAALLFACVFTVSHGMEGTDSIAAVILLFVAAIWLNSRRVWLSATVFSIVSFLNVYVVYAFNNAAVYSSLILVLSALEVVALGFLLYQAYHVLVQKQMGASIKVEALEDTSFEQRALQAAGERLSSTPKKNKMHKKDYLVMAIITVVYAVVAFTNLGSLTIPEKGLALNNYDAEIVIELEQETFVQTLKYYTGYCEGKFFVHYSTDGVNYTMVNAAEIDHPYRLMFRWEMIDIGAQAKYIKIVPSKGKIEFREIGLFTTENKILPLKGVQMDVGGTQVDGTYLINEQDQVPETTDYMTEMYFDEIYHARTAYEYIEGIYPYEITHPPLGKSIITIGIKIFGFNPFGWRFMGALFGVLMLPLFYFFAKKLFGKTIYAASAVILFASDFMHFTLTRIATIDSYSIFFILAMYYFMYLYTQRNMLKEPLWKTLIPLGLCGISFALGAATKWICLYAGAGLAIVFFHTLYKSHQEYRYAKIHDMADTCEGYRKKLITTLLFCVLVFIIIPVAVYILSYIPYQNTAESFGLKGILENQKYMLSYHGLLDTQTLHPYQSSVYTWPFDIRPVFFFRADNPPEGMAGVIWNMGNPLIFIGGLVFILYLIGLRKKDGDTGMWSGMSLVAIAAIMGYVPWMLVSRETFIYHYFAVIPFLILATVYALRHIAENYAWGKKMLYGYVGAAGALFFLFYPANTGIVVSRKWLDFIQWYKTWPI